jgi:predicted RND superfamily exporter protein
VRPIYDPDDPPDPGVLRQKVMNDPFLAQRLVSADGKVAAVALTVEALNNDAKEKKRVAEALREVTRRLAPERGVEFHLAGSTMLDDAFLRYTQRDTIITFPLIFLAIVVAVMALFRTPWALLLPMSVVGTGALWIAGVMGATGIRMTVLHSAIFPMLLGMGIANSMHIMNRAVAYRADGLSAKEAGEKALHNLFIPSAMTAFTSALGLMSLYTTSLKPLRQLGLLGAGGVVAAFFLTFTLGPYLLPLLPARTRSLDLEGGTQSGGAWMAWDRLLVALARAVQRRPLPVVVASMLLVAAAGVGISRLEMGINALNYFKDDDRVRIDTAFVDEHLAGTLAIEVLVETGATDGVKEPEILRRMQVVQDYMTGKPGVGHLISAVDYIKEIRRLVRGGDESERQIPATRAEVAQLLLLLEDPGELATLVDADWKNARITAQVRGTQIPEIIAGMPDLDAVAVRTFPAPAQGGTTGMTKLVRNMENYLLMSQVRSLGTAFLTVLITMIAALRSLRLGVFAMIPNIVPITLVLGLMGFTGIQLDPGTAMTGAVAMGLVVDDTVHFLHHLRERLMAGDSVAVATEHTLLEAGRAAAMSALVLSCAFWVGCTASFKPNIYFGLLSGITILLAAVVELVLLPAVLMLVPERLLKLAP